MRRERVVNKLRELGYKFVRTAWRIQIWRHPQSLHIVEIRNRDDVSDVWVRQVLRKAGQSDETIEAFIRSCTN